MIEIRRNRVSLGTAECLPWEIPPGPLRLRARRDGESLALSIQEKPPLEIVDLFALGPDEAGCFAVIWPKEVGVQRLQLRRPNMPATASSLEQADGHFAAGRFSEALEDYRRAGETLSDRSVQLESQYKAGDAWPSSNAKGRPQPPGRGLPPGRATAGRPWRPASCWPCTCGKRTMPTPICSSSNSPCCIPGNPSRNCCRPTSAG